ncbi:P-loop containing nucleoside triphosphate hydrolase protein [Xylaria intraflava]|nr:P-loop containing nucleoside triphosphate hydrolase protein [Xylaria intraflava]
MMDKYESIHGKDVSSFDFTSTHRLPTVSAAQAFDDLETDPQQFIPTGIEVLDRTLAGVSLDDDVGPQRHSGIRKGQIIEVWGPPGSGKTTFAMQLTARALQDRGSVVWVDTFHPLCHHRLSQIIDSSRSSEDTATSLSVPDAMTNLIHYFTPTLAHLIGLLCKLGASSVPDGTSLIVVDGLSGLLNHAFPRNLESRQNAKGPGPGPAARRLQVLQSLISALQKLSATRNLVIVILSQCATRMQQERGATMIPAINTSAWEQGVDIRLVLFQDWSVVDTGLRNVRLIGVQKSNGQASPDGVGMVTPFEICNGGLAGLDLETNQPALALAANPHRQKRKFHETDLEVADSEGEDYGWEDDYEANMPNMPPQWQGSEDLLLGRAEEDDNLTTETPDPEDPYRDTAPLSSDPEHEQQRYHDSP